MSIDLLNRIVDSAPDNQQIYDALVKCYAEIETHESIMASISGGSDSDIMMDMICRCGGKDKTHFVFFDTGFEYDATKRHIEFLSEKYGVTITTIRPVKAIPTCVKEYGVPFLSKLVSEYISRLQRHGFQWEDEPFDVLYARYPKCKSALRWWCNEWGEGSQMNIGRNAGLKEFMILNPPEMPISNKCCEYAKKTPAHRFEQAHGFDMSCTGVRRAEGGARATAYSSCFDESEDGIDRFRPLYWLTNRDKAEYEAHYAVTHSDCYCVWGMTRTGCAGCPYNKHFDDELALVKQYEPKRYKALVNIFGTSYEYTRKYREFQKKRKSQLAGNDQLRLF